MTGAIFDNGETMKTIKRADLSKLHMVASGEKKQITKVIDNGVVKEWVGIGWITLDAPTDEERKTLPVVKD